jgi:Domain of unknown function DUF11
MTGKPFDTPVRRCEHREVQGISRAVVLVLSAAALSVAAVGPAAALGGTAPRAFVSQDEAEADVRFNVTGGRNAQPGKGVRFRFRVRNTGRVAFRSVRVSTRLPRTLKHVRGGRYRPATRTVEFALGPLPPGRAQSRLLVARVAEGSDPSRQIVLRATVEARPRSD